ncbi:putative 3-oxoadipate enol-lactonase I [Rosellinia necatrix]|uniref:Putative 3-oxoadipate enol-lactonase I n=1 Tax=Rosellinia necatrix TaxID=77044 RepID=A0A1W2TK46_ROSNE|nr:putative 3-oxoadipate enol-lactonase I [Rosellinia necatrix]
MSGPGSLFVTMQPQPGLPLEQFHEWYNNEHGPTRLRLPQIFASGLRYRATDGQEPAFLAAYDVTAMSHLETEAYTCLRANRSPREAETIAQVDVDRTFWDLALSKESPQFVPAEKLTDDEAEGRVLVAVQLTPKGEGGPAALQDSADEIQKWYGEEHMDMLSRVPGWLRSRLFRISSLETDSEVRFLALHDYARENGLGGSAVYQAATSTPRTKALYAAHATMSSRRVYALFYVFGPAPRDLHHLSLLPPSSSSPSIPFRSADGKTFTTNTTNPSFSPFPSPSLSLPASYPVIESTITTPDGLEIPYRLEGNPSPAAPTLALCNSLLTSLRMWDRLVPLVLAARPHYRILRYDARGRHAFPRELQRPVTLDMLAGDLAALLDALRIPALHALLGVSAGGATALSFALAYPDRFVSPGAGDGDGDGAGRGRLVACDFNAASSPANTDAWRARVAAAEDDMRGLAAQTVRRWFHPETMARSSAAAAAAAVGAGDDGGREKKKKEEVEEQDTVAWMTDMVAANDVGGFRHGCQALWDYDLRPRMRACAVPALLVAGEADAGGALVAAMRGFRGLLGKGGAELAVVPATGHLPMCEDPEAFWAAVEGFL